MSESPERLRDHARRYRRLARCMTDTHTIDALNRLAVQSDEQANIQQASDDREEDRRDRLRDDDDWAAELGE